MESRDLIPWAELRQLDGPSLANAIESCEIRLRNEGFADGSIRAIFGRLPPMAGRAVTARIRCSTPPPVGHQYLDRTDLWSHIEQVPPPRVLVVQDVDDRPGFGAFVGSVHAHVLRALGCVGYVTNGSVRDLDAVEALGFPLFAGSVAISHAFVHLLDFGKPVAIGGLSVRNGDVLFGDRHGVLNVPETLSTRLPGLVAEMRARERPVIDFCESPSFSVEQLRTLVRQLP